MRNQQSVCKWQNLKFNNVLFCTLELEYQLRFVPLQVYWWCHLSLQCHSYHIKQCTMDQVHASSHTKNKKAVASYAIVPLHLLLQSGQEHKVTQFQMSCWTPDGLCTSPPAIMAVIEHVLVIQRRTGNKPIVVHGRWASWLRHHSYMSCYYCYFSKPAWYDITVGVTVSNMRMP